MDTGRPTKNKRGGGRRKESEEVKESATIPVRRKRSTRKEVTDDATPIRKRRKSEIIRSWEEIRKKLENFRPSRAPGQSQRGCKYN